MPQINAPSPSSHDSPVPPPELKVGDYAAFVGMDWGDRSHAIALSPSGQNEIESATIVQSAEALKQWLDSLEARFEKRPVAFAIEAGSKPVMRALQERSWAVIYAVHPATSARMRSAFTPSGAKDDPPDARTLLSILQQHRDKLRVFLPHDDQTEKVALLCAARRKTVDRGTLVSNKLTSLLKGYYPQALKMAGTDLKSPMALDFLSRWPDVPSLKKARPATLRNFYQAHNVRRPETITERLELAATAVDLTTNKALVEVSVIELHLLIAELRVLHKHISHLDDVIAEAFAAHPEASFFKELPGAGPALAPRLLAAFGTDRSRYPDCASLQKFSGIAPVTERSGKKTWVHWRLSAPKFLRQTFVEWAAQTVTYSTWAAAYYQQQKNRGAGRSAILRSLAFKWLRILWRCWQNRTVYVEQIYLKQLAKRSSPLIQIINKLSAQNT